MSAIRVGDKVRIDLGVGIVSQVQVSNSAGPNYLTIRINGKSVVRTTDHAVKTY